MERRAIAVRGVVQGVGFRPFVYGLASHLELGGFVKNWTGGVLIEVEGDASSLDCFLAELARHPPPLARVEQLSWQPQPPRGEGLFRIETSEADPAGAVFISPDVATCADCLAELGDPADPRYLYPFLNCTNCGPRLTIVRGAPYDRERTTMASFPMCARCRREYEDPSNRRFHAQPTACPDCGPQLGALDALGRPLAGDPLTLAASTLRAGRIVAVKGLGGFHLACDARSEAAVSELRRRKQRDEKPFALMTANIEAAEALGEVSPAEKDLLLTWRRPIVLIRKRSSAQVAQAVAPGNPFLGIMLPYTPVHHLLLRTLDGMPLVMTSGNRSDEPIAYEDGDAVKRLRGIADLFLTHNRAIHVRCDDSVIRVAVGQELFLRRSRGYAPEPIPLPLECPRPILAVGGQLKDTFALGRHRHAFLSHHLGDLDHYGAYQAFVRDIALYEQLLNVRPELIVHDLHPDYASTRYARERGGEETENGGVAVLAVQHHHAHMASCMAEHGLQGQVVGVAFDGTGFGTDGAIWGGEFLVGDYQHFRRAAHLRYVGMPGGEQAIREPWRMALAHLLDAGEDASLLQSRLSGLELRTVARMLERRFHTPPTSSMGRLFDAVASLAGVRDRVSYEGQAAIELEWLAMSAAADGVYPFDLVATQEDSPAEPSLLIDTRPLIRAVAAEVRQGVRAPIIGRRFHATVVEIIARVCDQIRQMTGLPTVVLSGGVFLNVLLTEAVSARLEAEGFAVYRQRLVPPNDGGLSLGQLAIAAAQSVG